jgi:uncharacterized protein
MVNVKKDSSFEPPPRSGAWRFLEPLQGFEVTRFRKVRSGFVLEGTSSGLEGGALWSLRYVIQLDSQWRTRHGRIENDLGVTLTLTADGAGQWLVNGKRRRTLDGCLDLDLEASLVTNMAPVRRLALRVGEGSPAPACYVRHQGLKVERLEQHYQRAADKSGLLQLDYDSPRFGYHARLQFGRDGLVIDYPHIGKRVTPPPSRRRST